MGLLTNARLANLWTAYANVVKSSLGCCVRFCDWPCSSSVKCASPKRNFSADVILS
ncbi:unnamed protein product [Callosobruchus maculatus]|uniref:Uncharacterized protein n=1 Tax=Callosobruchus maculatus TaxID=64391 RepID=A0A653DUS7_CALMS|nr:unnamed protein product [Callosobruchus maculatus]